MGQQQLLLLVLGIVIVGLAVVAGISAFNESKRKSEVDTFTSQGVEMAGEVIAWYMKPTAQGGGGGVQANLAGLTIDDLGYAIDPSYSTTWAGHALTGTVSNGVIRFLGTSTTHPFFHIHPLPLATGITRVEVHVFGPHRECIMSRTNRYNVGTNWSDGKSETQAPDNPNPALCTW